MEIEKVDFIELAMSPANERKAFIAAATPTRLGELARELTDFMAPIQQALEDCGDLQREIRYAIEKNAKMEQIAGRRSRAKAKGASLRALLMASPNGPPDDRQLRDLALCTKSGATVCLESLGFEGEDKNVTELARARELFKAGRKPRADWRLHYVDEKGHASGFGWERNFLDEIFVATD